MALLELVSQEMSNDTLVVRQHLEDLNTKSQVMVYASQEALFFKNGQALDLFGAGRHTLETANLPLIKKFFSNLFGGKTPFPCDVFFINKVSVLDFAWGTDSPIPLSDPKHHVIIGVRANGQTGIRITDSTKFVVKVVGMLQEFSTETLKKTVKGLMMSSIKECISQTIDEKKVSILEITSKLSEISGEIQRKLNARISDLGITLDHFSVNAILASEGDLDELRKSKNEMATTDAEAYKMQILSEARAKARAVEGFTYQDERRFDVLENAAKNEGAAGGIMNLGVGLGMGTGVGREVGKMASDINSSVAASAPAAEASCSTCGSPMPATAKFCPNCGAAKPVARFCPECGNKAPEGAKFCPSCGTKLA